MTEGGCEGELCPGVHISLVVVFDQDHFVPADSGPDGRALTDIESTVPGNHYKSELLVPRQAAAFDQGVVGFHETAHCRSPVLEKVVDVRYAMGTEGVSGGHDHCAARVELNDDVAIDTLQKDVQAWEYPAARTGPVTGDNALGLGSQQPFVEPFQNQLIVFFLDPVDSW